MILNSEDVRASVDVSWCTWVNPITTCYQEGAEHEEAQSPQYLLRTPNLCQSQNLHHLHRNPLDQVLRGYQSAFWVAADVGDRSSTQRY
jgi:hypothetical protein